MQPETLAYPVERGHADGPSRGSSEGIRVKFMHDKLVELVVEKTLGKLRPGLTVLPQTASLSMSEHEQAA